MYLHLGGDCSVAFGSIIAICDIKTQEEGGKSPVAHLLQEKEKIRVLDKEPRSVVVTDDVLYFSAISSLSLKRRLKMFF